MLNGSFDYWRVLEVSGVWAAALATLYAARTALSIASRTAASFIEVRAKVALSDGNISFSYIDNRHFSPDSANLLRLEAINTGLREAVVDEFSWKHPFLGKLRAFQPVTNEIQGKVLPFILKPGHSETFFIPIKNPIFSLAESIIEYVPSMARRWAISRLRFQISLSTDEMFCAPASIAVRRLVEAAMREIQKERER